jgi:lysophospholipase L1-like esterase
MPDRLPSLRRPRRRINLTDIAKRFLSGVREVDATIEPFARYWDDHNHAALHETGPLWVALGDSVTQGIGASEPSQSYVSRVHDELRHRTGEPWRVINLAMSGARFTDVVTPQITALHASGLQPDLVTAVIGSNDVIWRRDIDAIVVDAERLLAHLPHRTVLSRLGRTRVDRRRVEVNKKFDAAAETGAVRLYQAWDWPTAGGMWAADKFHPNDRAYGHLADNLVEALDNHGIV